jgi:hypothetical protein
MGNKTSAAVRLNDNDNDNDNSSEEGDLSIIPNSEDPINIAVSNSKKVGKESGSIQWKPNELMTLFESAEEAGVITSVTPEPKMMNDFFNIFGLKHMKLFGNPTTRNTDG